MDNDPWADSPPTPRIGTPRVSLDKVEPTSSALALPVSPQSDITAEKDASLAKETTDEGLPDTAPEVRGRIRVEAAEAERSLSPEAVEDEADGFDDFDDFDAPEAGPSSPQPEGAGDAFGDFGDFEEGDFEEESAPPADIGLPGPSTGWVSPPGSLIPGSEADAAA